MSQNELHVVFGTGTLGKWTAQVKLILASHLSLKSFKAMLTIPDTISK